MYLHSIFKLLIGKIGHLFRKRFMCNNMTKRQTVDNNLRCTQTRPDYMYGNEGDPYNTPSGYRHQ